MSDSNFLFFVNVFTIGIAVFSANLLISRARKQHCDIALAVCLLSLAMVLGHTSLTNFSPNISQFLLIATLPTMFLIGPTLWCYVEGITSQFNWSFNRGHIKHFALAFVGLCIATTTFFLPHEVKHHLLVLGTDSFISSYSSAMQYLVYGLVISTFVLLLFWVIQTAYYYVKITKRLSRYRTHLKQVFSSNDKKELSWLSFVLLTTGVLWLLAAINLTYSNLTSYTPINESIFAVIALSMIWVLAQWGLRQKPGFEELYDNSTIKQQENNAVKYQHSALDQVQAERIAQRIAKAMHQDKLYLDASLSLPKLAQHIATSPNYISQTLNQTLSISFFDYVNHQRIEAAKKLLTDSNDTVLDIAMQVGFNAKSSFYTAFKKETQMTPSQYRKTVKP